MAGSRNSGARPGREQRDPFGRRLEAVAAAVAVAGGIVLVLLTAFTVISVVGRAVFNSPILGDAEVTEIASGIAIFAFLPYCQIKGGNIVVDFFTAGLAPRRKAVLDLFNNVVFTAVIAIVTWRLVAGGIDAWRHREISMMLGLPVWLGYLAASAASILLVLTCLHAVLVALRRARA